ELIGQLQFLAEGAAQFARERCGMRDVEDHELAQQLRMRHREVPRGERAPIVADEDARRAAESLDQRADVVDDLRHPIRVDVARLRRLSVTAHVGCDCAEARASERGELMPPGVAEFGEAVEEDDQWSVALLDEVQFDGGHERSRLRAAYRRPAPRASVATPAAT